MPFLPPNQQHQSTEGKTNPVNGLFLQVNVGKPDLNQTRDDGVSGWQWHQLDHMQTICTLFWTDNHITEF